MTGRDPSVAAVVEASHGGIKLERMLNRTAKLSTGFIFC